MANCSDITSSIIGIFIARAALPAIIGLSLILLAAPVLADEARPCSEDIANFCKDVRPGGGRILLCLKNHEGDLTPVCSEKLAEVRKRIEQARQDCAKDVQQFCKGVQEGEGRIARCLGNHSDELSPACLKHVEWAKSKLKKVNENRP
jgi:hypothetical protein